MNAQEFAIKAHADTNHMYDKYLPYEFHLRMVNKVCERFANSVYDQKIYRVDPRCKPMSQYGVGSFTVSNVRDACWLHDVIEDARVSYNDICSRFGKDVAELVFRVTNNRGRNRGERADSTYYIGIQSLPGATFVKLCDRIANAQYSKMTGSRQFEMYKSEHSFFRSYLWSEEYKEMFDYLEEILEWKL